MNRRLLTGLRTLLPLALLVWGCSDDDTIIPYSGAGSSSGGTSGSSGGTSGGNGGTGGTGADTTAPTVLANFPRNAAAGESTSAALSVTFSEAMEADTITSTSFILRQGAVPIPGAVSYVANVASFLPAGALALDTTYTATITTQAEDVAGNALAQAHTWTFRTEVSAALGPAPVLLGAAGTFAILAKSAVSSVPTSVITGDLGLSPAATSYVTGFSLTRAGAQWSSPQVFGGVFAADNDPPTPIDLGVAVRAMEAAYTDAAGRPTPTELNLEGGDIGGLTIAPGLYKWTSAVTIATDLTLAGAANDVWIFQITGDLTLSAAQSMILSGGARAKNIVWQVAGTATLGTTSHGEGIILSQTAIQLDTLASINGRLLAQTAVSLDSATVTEPAP